MAIFRLTGNVLVQDDVIDPATVNVTSWADIKDEPAADITRISHVVNWFKGDEASNALQAITAGMIQRAAKFAEYSDGGSAGFRRILGRSLRGSSRAGKPRLIACVAEKELDMVPFGFRAARPLTRSILDLRSFNVPKRLPLLFDILERGAHSAYQEGFIIFSNSDICLMPHFYRSVRDLLSLGIDCLITNRRTVGQLSAYGSAHKIAMNEVGQRHAGFDCFVFPVAWVERFICTNACVGAGWVMRSLLYNLVVQAKRMLIMRDAHLTYHFGNDEAWAESKLLDYVAFNLDQARSLLAQLCVDKHRRALLSAFCQAHQELPQPEPVSEP
jgi:hypothetical protein